MYPVPAKRSWIESDVGDPTGNAATPSVAIPATNAANHAHPGSAARSAVAYIGTATPKTTNPAVMSTRVDPPDAASSLIAS